MASSILETKNLSFGYGDRLVKQDLNIAILKGELVGIIGLNGVGKSTLLRVLLGLQTPHSGDVYIENYSIRTLSASAQSRLMTGVLTDPLETTYFTVRELLHFGRYPHTNWCNAISEEDHHKIEQIGEFVGIADWYDRKCNTLSDGQLQRVLIAKALVQDTSLVILDEPTTHLDVNGKAMILSKLKQMVDTLDKTVIFTSHDIAHCLQICDKILLITAEQYIYESPDTLIQSDILNQNFFDPNIVHYDGKQGVVRIKI